MKLLKKLQSLPEKTRKVILWSVVIVLGICLLIWWFNGFQRNITGFQGEQFMEGFNFPKIEMPQTSNIKIPQLPEISEDGLEELKEATKENGEPR